MTKQDLEAKVLEQEQRLLTLISSNITLMSENIKLRNETENVLDLLKQREDELYNRLENFQDEIDVLYNNYLEYKECIEWLEQNSPILMLVRDYVNEEYKEKVGETIYETADLDGMDLVEQMFNEIKLDGTELIDFCKTNNTIIKAINNKIENNNKLNFKDNEHNK